VGEPRRNLSTRARPRSLVALAALVLAWACTSESAVAAPPCADQPSSVRTLLENQGTLESVIADESGRLFFTNEDSVLRLDGRGEAPELLAHVPSPGGLAFDADGSLIVGSGNTAANGTVGDLTGPSSLVRIDPDTGAQQLFATGLSMGNGLARDPAGNFYASNDFGMNIDRIRNGQTERGWAHVDSGNGLVVDTAGRYLYAAQTFRPAAIQRVDLANPANVTPHFVADPADIAAGFDGMARDDADRIFVAANASGEIWRVSGTPATGCLILDGLPGFPDGPSAVATGGNGTFPATNLYAVTFDGKLIELVGAAISRPGPAPAAQEPVPPAKRKCKRKRKQAGKRKRAAEGTTAAGAARKCRRKKPKRR
jgi:hypothetical protein